MTTTLTADEALDEFRAAGALLEGHFILSSGLHSPVFLQKMFVFQDPARTERLCRALAAKAREAFGPIDVVASPAVGGIVPGYETARWLGAKAIFVERENGAFRLQARLLDRARRAGADGRGHHHHRAFVARVPRGARRASGNDRRRGLPDRPLGRQGGHRRARGSRWRRSTFRPILPTRCRRSSRRCRRSSPAAGRSPAPPERRDRSDDRASPRRQRRPCRDRAQRARRGAARSGPRGAARHRGRGRRDHRASARGPPPHPRRRHAPPQGLDHEAAQFRDGGDRGDARHRAAHPPARLLPGAGKAHRADDRGRPRRGRRLPRAEALRRRTRPRRDPGLDVHRALGRGA